MGRIGEWWRRIIHLFQKRQFNPDLEEELRFHLDMRTGELGPAAARVQFGNPTRVREDSRDAGGFAAAEACWDDVRYACRTLRNNRAFAVTAILTLALGIGASTAVFSVVSGVPLRPLPFPHPEKLAMIWETRAQDGDDRVVVSYENFRGWKEQSHSFEHLAAFVGDGVRTTVADEPAMILGSRVNAGFFDALGVQPQYGRVFAGGEYVAKSARVIILSDGLWRRLGADPALVGQPVRFDREVFTVVGIMPTGFAFPAQSELWFPFTDDDSRNQLGTHYLRVIGRLRPGANVEQAQDEIQTITGRLREAYPKENKGVGANVVPLLEQTVGEVGRALLIFMAAVGCLLLIACANVASLLLVRSTGRRRETALRIALGASRGRIVRWLLTESVMLSLAGTGLGLVAASWLVRAFVALDPIHLPRIGDIALDGPVLLYAAGAGLLTGILCGIGRALRASKSDQSSGLRESSGSVQADGFGAGRLREGLTAAEVALSVMLLVCAGLLVRSFIQRISVPLGFRPYRLEQHLFMDSQRIRTELGYAEPVSTDEAPRRTIRLEKEDPPADFDVGPYDSTAEDEALRRNP